MPLTPKSLPAVAVPLFAVHVTEAPLAVLPVRVTVSTTLAEASLTLALGAENCSVLSSSAMVTVVEVGTPRVAPVAPESDTVKVRLALTAKSSLIVTGMVLGAASPSAQVTVPGVPT